MEIGKEKEEKGRKEKRRKEKEELKKPLVPSTTKPSFSEAFGVWAKTLKGYIYKFEFAI